MNRDAAARLGAVLRTADEAAAANAPLIDFASGSPADRAGLEQAIGADLVADLIARGIAHPDGGALRIAHALAFSHGLLFCAPDADPDGVPRGDALYLGPDSAMLSEVALRVAPQGKRAVDLGAGTGLHTALLAQRFDVVVATDVSLRAARAARLTLELNGLGVGAVVADTADGLRPGSFDLVTVNAPWVPVEAVGGSARLFADGGPTGAELPCRFIRSAAALLRPGGVGVVMALDVTSDRGDQPVRAECALLDAKGYFTRLLRTPLNGLRPDLEAKMRARQPSIVTAQHVAVVFAPPSDRVASVAAAVDRLAERWATVPIRAGQRASVRDSTVTGKVAPAS